VNDTTDESQPVEVSRDTKLLLLDSVTPYQPITFAIYLDQPCSHSPNMDFVKKQEKKSRIYTLCACIYENMVEINTCNSLTLYCKEQYGSNLTKTFLGVLLSM